MPITPLTIPFLPSESNYTLSCSINDVQYMFDVRWNSRDEAWYFDMYEADDTPVALNVKVVTGVNLGRTSQHEFFRAHRLTAVDTTGQGQSPGFDELNTRALVVVTFIDEDID